MTTAEISSLLGIFAKAADHHDPATLTQYNLGTLATDAAGVAPSGGIASVFEALLQNPAVVSAIVGLLAGLLQPHAAAPVAPVAPTPEPVAPVAPAAPVVAPKGTVGAMPDAVGLDVSEVFGPNRTGRSQRKFRVDAEPVDGVYNLVMLDDAGSLDKTTSLDDGSGLYLAGILMLDGKAVKVEEVPGAKDRLFWRCKHVESGEVNLLTGEGASANGATSNWREDEFVRTGGFDVVLHLAKAGHYDISFGVLDTQLEAQPIRTPEVR